jgi:hypothetical protein
VIPRIQGAKTPPSPSNTSHTTSATYVVLRFETFYGMSNIDLQKCVPEEEVKNRIRQ